LILPGVVVACLHRGSGAQVVIKALHFLLLILASTTLGCPAAELVQPGASHHPGMYALLDTQQHAANRVDFLTFSGFVYECKSILGPMLIKFVD
jgi:hypothetical protein